MDIDDMTVDEIFDRLRARCPAFMAVVAIPEEKDECSTHFFYHGNKAALIGFARIAGDQLAARYTRDMETQSNDDDDEDG